MTLTAKQSAFVTEYLLDLNATQAAIRAGYSKKTANRIGPELLTKEAVIEAVAAAQAARAERTKIDADWVLRRLAEEAEADIGDLYDEQGDLKPVHEWPIIWRKGLVAGIEIEALFEGVGEDRHQTGLVKKLKLSDRIKRIELIGKHVNVQAFREQVGLGGPDGGPIKTETRTWREVLRQERPAEE